LTLTQKFGSNVSITLGKFNMLDAATKTPIMGGGGETTFWNTAFAAPISGVTPPYIIGGLLALKTEPATFSLLLRSAERPGSPRHRTSVRGRRDVKLVGLAMGAYPDSARCAQPTARSGSSISKSSNYSCCHPDRPPI
jgi:hypothetical protein